MFVPLSPLNLWSLLLNKMNLKQHHVLITVLIKMCISIIDDGKEFGTSCHFSIQTLMPTTALKPTKWVRSSVQGTRLRLKPPHPTRAEGQHATQWGVCNTASVTRWRIKNWTRTCPWRERMGRKKSLTTQTLWAKQEKSRHDQGDLVENQHP